MVFRDWNLPWLPLLALVPVGLSLESLAEPEAKKPLRRGWVRGFLVGVGFFTLGLFWIGRLPLRELTHPWVLLPGLGLLVAYLSCFPALMAVNYLLLRRAGVPAPAALPLAWLAWERIKGLGEMGFPWLSLGYAWFRHPE